ncbi:hypothetical protein BDB01DRAFT_806789 [Pilobolus umbonatus]|nr:hypothetical protein BDB01DRAFT_806789 [Pilobolus umbonatus]
MKFSFSQLAVSALGFLSVANAGVIRRQEAIDHAAILAQYNNINVDILSGGWYVTGFSPTFDEATQFSFVTRMSDSCFSTNVARANDISIDTSLHLVIQFQPLEIDENVELSLHMQLQSPGGETPVGTNELLWYSPEASQYAYVNGQIQQTVDSNGGSNLVYTKLIDSAAGPGSTTVENLDTLLVWIYEAPVEGATEPAPMHGVSLTRASVIDDATLSRIMANSPFPLIPFHNSC